MRLIQINASTKSYLVVPLGADDGKPSEGNASAASQTSARTGGTIDVQTTVVDTQERKEMLGRTARHLRVVVSQHTSPNACAAVDDRTEIDGWYVDFEMPVVKQESTGGAGQSEGTNCHDEVRNQNTGDGKTGFPVEYTMKRWEKDNATPLIMAMQVLELSTASLDAFASPEQERVAVAALLE